MRPTIFPVALLAVAAVQAPARAADAPGRDAAPVPAYIAPERPVSLISELRIGGSAQDSWSNERGSGSGNGELLFAKPFTPADRFWSVFVPRPTIGGSANLSGRTSYGYAGATWTFDLTDRIFVEGFFGGAVHDGDVGRRAFAPPHLNALGCSPLFREAAALGVRLTEHWSVMATVEHMSNAGLCIENRGLTNVGAKLGYTF